MQAKQSSSAWLTFLRLAKVGFFLVLAGVLGVGLAVITAAFVLGDLSGAWQTGKAVAGNGQAKRMVRVSYVEPASRTAELTAAKASPEPGRQPIPAPLAPVPSVADSEPVRVARALPVFPGVPVRRAQPVMISVPSAFDARAEVADDDAFIPRARPVSPAEMAVQDRVRSYQPTVVGSVAQRDAASLNW